MNGFITAIGDRSVSWRTNSICRSYCEMFFSPTIFFREPESFMNQSSKPYVHLPIDAVDTVVVDLEGRFETDQYDRYSSFAEACDAARSSIEIMLDEGDYDGDDHRDELVSMLDLLEMCSSFEDLAIRPVYQRILEKLDVVTARAA